MSSSRIAALQVLGLTTDATEPEILKAYRKAILRTHPDKGGSETAFIEVQEAFRVINESPAESSADAEFDAKVDASFEDLIASIFRNLNLSEDNITVTTTTSHSRPARKCRNWNGTHGSCKHGTRCKFSHPTKICSHFNSPSGCKYGDRCNNLHLC